MPLETGFRPQFVDLGATFAGEIDGDDNLVNRLAVVRKRKPQQILQVGEPAKPVETVDAGSGRPGAYGLRVILLDGFGKLRRR